MQSGTQEDVLHESVMETSVFQDELDMSQPVKMTSEQHQDEVCDNSYYKIGAQRDRFGQEGSK